MIRYTFTFEPDKSFDFTIDQESDTSAEDPDREIPSWMELEKFRCEPCTVPPGSRKSCPAALSIGPVIEAFDNRRSYEEVQTTVEINEATIQAKLPIQNVVRSLVGLMLPFSSCHALSKRYINASLHLWSGIEQFVSCLPLTVSTLQADGAPVNPSPRLFVMLLSVMICRG